MIETFLGDPVATAFGFAGAILAIAWPLFRGRTAMLLVQCGVHVAFIVHFYMLGAHTGSLMNVLALAQAAAAIPLARRPAFRLIYLTMLPFVAAGVILTWQGLPSVFSGFGMAFTSVARYQIRTMPFRLLLLVAGACWFGHNIVIGSVPGLTADVLSFGTALAMLWREARQPLPAAA